MLVEEGSFGAGWPGGFADRISIGLASVLRGLIP